MAENDVRRASDVRKMEDRDQDILKMEKNLKELEDEYNMMLVEKIDLQEECAQYHHLMDSCNRSSHIMRRLGKRGGPDEVWEEQGREDEQEKAEQVDQEEAKEQEAVEEVEEQQQEEEGEGREKHSGDNHNEPNENKLLLKENIVVSEFDAAEGFVKIINNGDTSEELKGVIFKRNMVGDGDEMISKEFKFPDGFVLRPNTCVTLWNASTDRNTGPSDNIETPGPSNNIENPKPTRNIENQGLSDNIENPWSTVNNENPGSTAKIENPESNGKNENPVPSVDIENPGPTDDIGNTASTSYIENPDSTDFVLDGDWLSCDDDGVDSIDIFVLEVEGKESAIVAVYTHTLPLPSAKISEKKKSNKKKKKKGKKKLSSIRRFNSFMHSFRM